MCIINPHYLMFNITCLGDNKSIICCMQYGSKIKIHWIKHVIWYKNQTVDTRKRMLYTIIFTVACNREKK